MHDDHPALLSLRGRLKEFLFFNPKTKQSDVANRIGLTQQGVSAFLLGDAGLSLKSYLQLDKFLTAQEQNAGARIEQVQHFGRKCKGSLRSLNDQAALMTFENPGRRENLFEEI